MPSFNPFTSVAGRHACSLFEIRLDNNFIVFRGGEHEAAGQLLKGTLVLCLKESLRVEDVHLRLLGNCRIAWLDGRQSPSGVHSQKVDRTTTILKHSWPPFVGESSHHTNLVPGNYEWPFEILLPGDTAESVEGLQHSGITYLLKATVSRGKLAKNLHAFKRIRIIRTLEPAALEFNHAMSVENIWPNKIEYSVVVPQKAVVFGSNIPMETRFTPLLKGLELGNISVKLVEHQELSLSGRAVTAKTHKHDREIMSWAFEVTRGHHWHDNIEETGQEGWVINEELPLPKRLSRCIQDCTVHGIKIRHKMKLTVALKNPDGHVSELRATLPVTIFISPNMPLDEDGNLVSQMAGTPSGNTQENSNLAPPGYGQHVLDQLYDDVDPTNIILSHDMSGVNSPVYTQSRTGSSENLASMAQGLAVPPAILSSRLQHVSLEDPERNSSFRIAGSGSGAVTPVHLLDEDSGAPTANSPRPLTADLSRHPSEEEHIRASGHNTPPQHHEFPDFERLSKVPSYATATRAPLPRTSSFTGSLSLPDYQTAISAPASPNRNVLTDPMTTIAEGRLAETAESNHSRSRSSSRSRLRQRASRGTFSLLHNHTTAGSPDGERRLRVIQSRSS